MSFGDTLRNASSGEFVEPPAGKYDVKIVRAEARETKSGPVAEVILEITAGPHQGAQVKHLMFFNHPVGVEINTEALVSYGVDLAKIDEVSDLDDDLQRIIGTRAEVGISYRNEYLQIKVHRSMPPEPVSDIPSDPEPVGFAARAAQKFGDEPAF